MIPWHKKKGQVVRSGLRWENFLKLVGDFSVIFEGAWQNPVTIPLGITFGLCGRGPTPQRYFEGCGY